MFVLFLVGAILIFVGWLYIASEGAIFERGGLRPNWRRPQPLWHQVLLPSRPPWPKMLDHPLGMLLGVAMIGGGLALFGWGIYTLFS